MKGHSIIGKVQQPIKAGVSALSVVERLEQGMVLEKDKVHGCHGKLWLCEGYKIWRVLWS